MDHHFVGIPELTGVPRVAVVIDVMRAFTVAAWAFSRGVEKIVLASTESEALSLKEAHPGWLALKDGPPAVGFDAVNSPGLLRARDFTGRTLVQKTTAGTVGALAVANAPLVLCASFAVAGPTARFLRARDAGPVTFVVTGDGGRADEDLACAEYIGRRMAGGDVEAAPYLLRARTSRAAADLAGGLRSGWHPDDVDLCLELDRFPFAMTAAQEGPLMVLRPVAVPAVVPDVR
ncbi:MULTISPECIES: 2-phosphosulfolactate phosphatase [Streptomyces]|uniref:Probable 2-phosphosulfolactate phosphatase n=1 Tax=Streptomyces stelliscabiei TaxID=146820 RepID=A0A8I0P1N3_9ACTN|nr:MULTISPECIES: 2-phosphosulfolactate phosphatase [Streptomyces]KND40512.1 2-phosphosulfolactate phosphatase [Streptomyces stelliscabiei]MBE1594629.1 2-phosphosulfolactate phosphatase [Streptomyces stelliscabiei]MDX2521106.1 2-phosphosulfolactate phosphatase [Streptomyces stelliscabiei]MDX2550773.1 2-phosphosulfolactate phosphatase [Streptomyces stelliscabiei]MDX2616844.1 2-phosphosulfolactate phosphatase [Streptomyces stelliscabiei]